MTKNSEISKNVDSSNISDESTSDQAKSVENGMNGVRSDAEKEEKLVQQDEDQVSPGKLRL